MVTKRVVGESDSNIKCFILYVGLLVEDAEGFLFLWQTIDWSLLLRGVSKECDVGEDSYLDYLEEAEGTH